MHFFSKIWLDLLITLILLEQKAVNLCHRYRARPGFHLDILKNDPKMEGGLFHLRNSASYGLITFFLWNDWQWCIQPDLLIDWLVYTEFILVWLLRKLLAYRHTIESVPGTNQYWAVSVKFLAQGNDGFAPDWVLTYGASDP